jgi:hypothetical protein
MTSPGLRHFLFVINILCSTGSKTSTITPSNDSDSVYDDMVTVLRDNIDEDCIPNANGEISGTIEVELPKYGDKMIRVIIGNDNTIVEVL